MHEIRLRGPWQAEVLQDQGEAEPALAAVSQAEMRPEQGGGARAGETQRRQPPEDWEDWLGRDFRGVVRYERKFGRPTGLHEDQKVWLVVEAVDWSAQVWLNEQYLGSLAWGVRPLKLEVQEQLQSHNRLWVDVAVPADAEQERASLRGQVAGGPVGEVRLEIED